jgi:hypothetical protein
MLEYLPLHAAAAVGGSAASASNTKASALEKTRMSAWRGVFMA